MTTGPHQMPVQPTQTLTCEHCGDPFLWRVISGGDPPSYCCHSHRTTAQRRRRADREALANAGRCDFPFKKFFPTIEDAWQFVADHHRNDQSMNAYPCCCGGFHIGHLRGRAIRPVWLAAAERATPQA